MIGLKAGDLVIERSLEKLSIDSPSALGIVLSVMDLPSPGVPTSIEVMWVDRKDTLWHPQDCLERLE